jgi:hypothetical protein
MLPEESEEERKRDSGMKVHFIVGVEYIRTRAGGAIDKWEARMTTVGLLLFGGIVAILFIWIIVPHVLHLITGQ